MPKTQSNHSSDISADNERHDLPGNRNSLRRRATLELPLLSLLASWQCLLLVTLFLEGSRIRGRLLTDGTLGDWWRAPNLESTYVIPLLLLAPFCWGFPFRNTPGVQCTPALFQLSKVIFPARPALSFRFYGAFFIGIVSLVCSGAAAQMEVPGETSATRIQQALPLVQDEFSYLLQSRASLEGRWSWDSPQHVPELFHQMHVLNDGRFASRYFPGTGLWFAFWDAIGDPVWGARCASMLICIGFFLIGCDIADGAAGLLAGGLLALSPLLAITGNLILSHSPCLVGVTAFLYGFQRFMSTGRPSATWLAGCGLTLAMLCRPLTAAAIGLPFGVWFVVQWGRGKRGCPCSGESAAPQVSDSRWQWILPALGLGIPLAAGMFLIGIQNRAITGNVFLTPYQQYNALYTPRHVFGFFQANRTVSSDQTLHSYNDWAADLDVALANCNVVDRLRGGLEWNLGLVPLGLGGLLVVLTLRQQSLVIQLVVCSILLLHLAHYPYWLAGMLDHHYVLESGPLWVLLFAVVSIELLQQAIRQQRWLFPYWWGAIVLLSASLNWFSLETVWESRIRQGWHHFTLPTAGYRVFVQQLNSHPLQRPALILVRPGPGDLHAQFVRNLPPFDSDLLIATDRPELYSVEQIQVCFPDRALYRYDSAKRTLSLISGPSPAIPSRAP